MNTTSFSNEDRRWMLVDDNADLLAMLARLVANLTSATVECHVSAESALAAFAADPESYDLVITDFEMPGMDGVELCRRVRAISPTPKLFLTTGSGLFSEAAALHQGFNALLNKPFPRFALQEKLAAAGLLEPELCAA